MIINKEIKIIIYIIFIVSIFYLVYKLLKNSKIIEGLNSPGIWGRWNHSCTSFGKGKYIAHLGQAQGDWWDATRSCLKNNDCGTIPAHDSNIDPKVEQNIGGMFGTVYTTNDSKCYPEWGNWNHSCLDIGKGKYTAHLDKIVGDWTAATNTCLKNNDCGTIPAHDSNIDPKVEQNIGGMFGTVYTTNDSKCYPYWLPWQEKRCTGIGQSKQSAKLILPPGVPNTDSIGKNAVLFCSGSGSSKCNKGNTALNTPSYGTGDTFTYTEEGIDERWGTVTKNDDTYCYPTWTPWQKKQCIGYQKAKVASKLLVDNWYDPKTKKQLNPTEVAEICLKPENFNKCSGPSRFLKQYTPSRNVPSIATSEGSKLIPSTQGVGEAWGEIQFKDTDLCRPKWETGKQKTKLRYGIAQYQPAVQYKDGGGGYPITKKECYQLLQDLSYTSIDDFTWTPSGELCKDDTCYSTTLVKDCTSDVGWTGGKFLKRDPSYASGMFGIWPWNWPQEFSDALSYYKGSTTDRIPE